MKTCHVRHHGNGMRWTTILSQKCDMNSHLLPVAEKYISTVLRQVNQSSEQQMNYSNCGVMLSNRPNKKKKR
jgi:hypothetical protein